LWCHLFMIKTESLVLTLLCSCTTRSWRRSLASSMIGWTHTSCSGGRPTRTSRRRGSSASSRWDRRVGSDTPTHPRRPPHPLCAPPSPQGRFCLHKLCEDDDRDDDGSFRVTRGIPPNGPVQVLVRVYIVSVRPRGSVWKSPAALRLNAHLLIHKYTKHNTTCVWTNETNNNKNEGLPKIILFVWNPIFTHKPWEMWRLNT